DMERTLEAARAGNAALERACERAEEAGLATRQQLAEFRERASLQEARVPELLTSSSSRITAPLRPVFGPLRRRRRRHGEGGQAAEGAGGFREAAPRKSPPGTVTRACYRGTPWAGRTRGQSGSILPAAVSPDPGERSMVG